MTNQNQSKTPLSTFVKKVVRKRKGSRKRLYVGFALLILIPYFGSTLAATLQINSGKAQEFGQGSQLAIACDTSITNTITETWLQSSPGPYFRVETIQLTNLNNTDNTATPAQDGGCGHKKLKIQLLDSGGSPIIIGTSSTTSVTIYVPTVNGSVTDASNGTVLNGNSAALTNTGATSTLTITIPSSTPVSASTVSRITIESVD